MRKTLILLVMAAGGCTVEGGNMIEILMSPLPTNCEFTTSAPDQMLQGFYDPTGIESFGLAVILRNHLPFSDFDEVEGFGEDVTPDSNYATVLGFEMCFFREGTFNSTEIDNKGKDIVNCDDVPEVQRRFIAATGIIEPLGDGLSFIDVLNHEDLRAVYGAAFDPFRLPRQGAMLDQGNVIFSYWSVSPELVLGVRDPNWGEYPQVREDIIVVQLRAQVKLQSGKNLRSNWWAIPIKMNPGSVDAQCGPLIQHQCVLACGGTPCPPLNADPTIDQLCAITTPGTCQSQCVSPAGQLCLPFAFEGSVPNTAGVCFAYQGAGGTACVPTDFCQ